MSETIIKSSKDDFITNLQAQLKEVTGEEVTKKQARESLTALEALFEGYKNYAAAEKASVHVQVFGGTLKFQFIAAHESRNPRTGQPVQVPDRTAVRLSTAPKNVSNV